jgi:hypothetical protein
MKQRQLGQGLVFYALILFQVAAVVSIILFILGPSIEAIFCDVFEDYPDLVSECPGTEEYISYESTKEAEPGAEEVFHMVEVLWEAASEQEENLEEAWDLMVEAIYEEMEAPIKYADETGDALLFDNLSTFRQKVVDGDIDGIDVGFLFRDVPEDVLVDSVVKYVPRAIDACIALNDQQVPEATFADAQQAVLAYEGQQGGTASEMGQIWDLIEARNTKIEESQEFLRESAELGIFIIDASGNLDLAEVYSEDLVACTN